MLAAKPSILLIIDSRNDCQRFNIALQVQHITCNEIILIFESQAAIATDLKDMLSLGNRNQNTSIKAINYNQLPQLLSTVQTDFVAYIPDGAFISQLPQITPQSNILIPWLPDVTLPKQTAKEISVDAVAWIASTAIAKFVLPRLATPDNWTILEIAQVLEQHNIPFRWKAANVSATPKHSSISPPITFNSKVLAVVPHYRCEKWLKRCLSSLVNQTRSPDKIVVIDDGSDDPPITIVEEFSQVTLLASSQNVGPYRLIGQAIADTDYDAYLFQDADDWSASDRLEQLLYTAADTGAELIGTQEIRVFDAGSKLIPVCYPLDVNAALAEKPGHPLLHPSSLVARNLVMRLGGFATGLRFGGDTEFLLRAALVARILNIPHYAYFRRKRPNSLTTAANTGLNSPARIELLKTLKIQALANRAAIQKQQPPNITPLTQASSIKLKYITGSRL